MFLRSGAEQNAPAILESGSRVKLAISSTIQDGSAADTSASIR